MNLDDLWPRLLDATSYESMMKSMYLFFTTALNAWLAGCVPLAGLHRWNRNLRLARRLYL